MSSHKMQSMTGQPVIAIDTAEEIGKVKHFVVDRNVERIDRLHIDGRKKKAVFVEWGNLESFGADRVMITTETDPHRSDAERDIDAARGDIELLGTRVLDTTGLERGVVTDATFDSETGRIISIDTSNDLSIVAASIHSLGSYAVVVDAV